MSNHSRAANNRVQALLANTQGTALGYARHSAAAHMGCSGRSVCTVCLTHRPPLLMLTTRCYAMFSSLLPGEHLTWCFAARRWLRHRLQEAQVWGGRVQPVASCGDTQVYSKGDALCVQLLPRSHRLHQSPSTLQGSCNACRRKAASLATQPNLGYCCLYTVCHTRDSCRVVLVHMLQLLCHLRNAVTFGCAG